MNSLALLLIMFVSPIEQPTIVPPLSKACARLDLMVFPGVGDDGEAWIQSEIMKFLRDVKNKCGPETPA